MRKQIFQFAWLDYDADIATKKSSEKSGLIIELFEMVILYSGKCSYYRQCVLLPYLPAISERVCLTD